MNSIDRINDLLDQAQLFCLATVIASSDQTMAAGHRIIILRDGTLEFGTGRPAVDGQIRSQAIACLSAQKKETVELAPGLEVFFDILAAAGMCAAATCGFLWNRMPEVFIPADSCLYLKRMNFFPPEVPRSF